MIMADRVVIAAGGTGGHVFPGLALAEAFAKLSGIEPLFVGTGRGLESKLVPEAGYAIELFDVTSIKGGGPLHAARGAWSAAVALRRAVSLLRRVSPRVVVSIGGYAAGPVSAAAAALGIPVGVVEPNSVMGLSNRLIAPLARRIYLAFDEARSALTSAKTRLSGVPLRSGFTPREARGSGGLHVLVLGGSQGAEALNERVPAALVRVAEASAARLSVIHQTGEGRDAKVRVAYAGSGSIDASVVPFSTTLAADLAWADLVVARAGAGTIAEVAAVGRAALLIPYPHAADDHQARNAAAYARTGAAVWLRQDEADATRIAEEVRRILFDEGVRSRLASRARSQGRPEAARTIAKDLLELAGVA